MTIEALDSAFQGHCDLQISAGLPAEFCLSVNAVPGMDRDAIARHSKRPNNMMRATTVQAIRDAGFEIVESPGKRDKNGHCDVFVQSGRGNKPDTFDLMRLQAAFGEPFKNPDPYRGPQ